MKKSNKIGSAYKRVPEEVIKKYKKMAAPQLSLIPPYVADFDLDMAIRGLARPQIRVRAERQEDVNRASTLQRYYESNNPWIEWEPAVIKAPNMAYTMSSTETWAHTIPF